MLSLALRITLACLESGCSETNGALSYRQRPGSSGETSENGPQFGKLGETRLPLFNRTLAGKAVLLVRSSCSPTLMFRAKDLSEPKMGLTVWTLAPTLTLYRSLPRSPKPAKTDTLLSLPPPSRVGVPNVAVTSAPVKSLRRIKLTTPATASLP